MIEKSLIIIVFLYGMSFSLLGIQFIAYEFGVTLKNFDGIPIENTLLEIINQDAFNQIMQNATGLNQTLAQENPIIVAAELTVLIFQLLTGTYIFEILVFVGVPTIFVAGISVLFGILMIRTLIAYFRGV